MMDHEKNIEKMNKAIDKAIKKSGDSIDVAMRRLMMMESVDPEIMKGATAAIVDKIAAGVIADHPDRDVEAASVEMLRRETKMRFTRRRPNSIARGRGFPPRA